VKLFIINKVNYYAKETIELKVILKDKGSITSKETSSQPSI
jgi:hypothetical protein